MLFLVKLLGIVLGTKWVWPSWVSIPPSSGHGDPKKRSMAIEVPIEAQNPHFTRILMVKYLWTGEELAYGTWIV